MNTRFFVSCFSEDKAYFLGNAFLAIAGVFLGKWPVDSHWKLTRLTSLPNADSSFDSIMELANDDDLTSRSQFSGYTLLDINYAKSLKALLKCIIDKPDIVDAIRNLESSYYLINGQIINVEMEEYIRIRKSNPQMHRKSYLENRLLFELSFLAAFRAIEALVPAQMTITNKQRRTSIKNADTALKKVEINYKVEIRNEKYQCLFRVPDNDLYNSTDWLDHFRKKRNSLAAHWGISSDEQYVSDTDVLEIQNYALWVVCKLINSL